jgi:hypothetical protein
VKVEGQSGPSRVSQKKRDPSAGSGQVMGHPQLEIQAVAVPTRKRLGEAVEAAFLAKATMLGIPVLKPWGDSRPYDFAVESGRRLWKVQVKCATSYRGTRCNARAAGSGPLYTLDDIDFLAAYVIRENLWYVVPADAFVPRATVNFNYGPNSQGMFEKYRETLVLADLFGRRRGAGAIFRSDAGARRCRCAARCVRRGERSGHGLIPTSRKRSGTWGTPPWSPEKGVK